MTREHKEWGQADIPRAKTHLSVSVPSVGSASTLLEMKCNFSSTMYSSGSSITLKTSILKKVSGSVFYV